jgi:hypothetical protein
MKGQALSAVKHKQEAREAFQRASALGWRG